VSNVDWDAFIDRSEGAIWEADAVWRSIAPLPVGRTDYLREATYTLRRVFIVTYRASLALLRDPEVSFPAEALLRGLLETWAHLAWIEYGESRGNRARARHHSRKRKTEHCFSDGRCSWSTPQTRALCWLYGDARWYHKNVRMVDSRLKGPTTTAQARRRANRYDHAHARTGCPGRLGRDFGDVEPMLFLLARKGNIPWATGLWRAYSATAHSATPVRLGRVPGGSMIEGPLPDFERRALLVRCLRILILAWQHILNLSDVDNVVGLVTFVDVTLPPVRKLLADLEALPC
jgi:hypothetical protein